MRRTALGDGAAEQPVGSRHGEQRADAHRSCRLAEDGDIARIAAEGGNVVAHPYEGGDLIEEANIGYAVAEKQEAICANSAVDGHENDAVAGKSAPVIDRPRTRLEHANG